MRFYKQLRKRGLALFMALVMCLSLVQVTAFADDELNANDAAGSDVVLSEDTAPPMEDSHEHVWDEGVTTPPADCVTDGETIYTCTAEGCGATKTEPVPAGHKSVVDVRVEPTETEPGLTEGAHCEVCGAILTAQETIPATGTAAPAEVQAFLDAVAALPGASEVTAYNAEVVGEQVNAVLDLYEGLIDLGLDEAVGVAEALPAVYAVYEAVLAAEEINDSDTFEASGDSLFSWDYHIYSQNVVDELNRKTLNLNIKVGVGETWVDEGVFRFWDKSYGVYNVSSWDNFDIWSTDEKVLKVTAVPNGKSLKIIYEGIADGTAQIKMAFNLTTISTGEGSVLGSGNWGAATCANCTVGTATVGKGGTPVTPMPGIPDYPEPTNLQDIKVYVECYTADGTPRFSGYGKDCYQVTCKLSDERNVDGWYCSNIRENKGELNTSGLLKRYPYACTLTLKDEHWVKVFNDTLATNNINKPTHYLHPLNETDSMTLLYNAEKGWWDYDTDKLSVAVIETAPSTTYTVTYTDGVDSEEVFKDQITSGLTSGANTPAFKSADKGTEIVNGTVQPKREGYAFMGWSPAVAVKVTGNVTYVATWEENKPTAPTKDEAETALNGKYTVKVKCINDQRKHTLAEKSYNISAADITSITTDPYKNIVGKWEVEVWSTKNVFIDKFDAETNVACEHDDKSGGFSVKLVWNGNAWAYGGTSIREVETECHSETKPTPPTPAVVGKLVGNVEVYCQPERHQVGKFSVTTGTDRITIGEVESSESDGYSCDVVFHAQAFCDAYNALKNTTGDKAHTLVSSQEDVSITFYWNAATEAWGDPEGETPVKFYVECPAPDLAWTVNWMKGYAVEDWDSNWNSIVTPDTVPIQTKTLYSTTTPTVPTSDYPTDATMNALRDDSKFIGWGTPVVDEANRIITITANWETTENININVYKSFDGVTSSKLSDGFRMDLTVTDLVTDAQLTTGAITKSSLTTNIEFNYVVEHGYKITAVESNYQIDGYTFVSNAIQESVTDAKPTPVYSEELVSNSGGTCIFVNEYQKDSAPNLSITKAVSKASVKKGGELEYTITVQNNGTANATNVVVTDTLPKELGTNISSSNPSSYSSSVNNGQATFTWELGTIEAGQSKTVTFKATAVDCGKITNSANVTSTEVTTPVESAPVPTVIYNLIVTKKNDGFMNGAPGSNGEDDGSGKAHVHYTVTVQNVSGFDLYGLDILDDLTTMVKADNESVNEGYMLTIENVKLDGSDATGMTAPVANGNATHSVVKVLDQSAAFTDQRTVTLTYDFVIENTGDKTLSVELENTATGGTWTSDGQNTPMKARARSAARSGGYDIEESASSGASMGSSGATGTVKPKGAAYKVEHYQENLDGTYSVKDTEDLRGTTGATATATAKTYEGFTENTTHADRVPSGTIAGNGSLVLKLYYSRAKDISYTVKYIEKDTNKVLHDEKTVNNQTFGATVTENAEPISDYTVDVASKTLTLKAAGNEIVFVYSANKPNPPKKILTVSANDVTTTYDGNTHPVTPVVTLDGAPVTDATVTVKYTDAAGNTISGDPVNAGTYTATITVIRDGLTAETTATVTINRRPLLITTGSDSKYYDGYPLTNSTSSYSPMPTGQSITVAVSGSQTVIGHSQNFAAIASWNNANPSNYEVSYNYGTLTVLEYTPYIPDVPFTPTPTPAPATPTPAPAIPGTTITDEETPLAGSVGLNDTDHFAYVIGYEDDTVRPLNNITRAEAATIFFRLMTDEYRQANWSTTNSFSDVNAGDWYNNAVSTCANAGVLKGYEDGTFRPNAPITRAEFASMAAGFMDESITDDGTGDFSDTANHWAAVAIRRAAKAGWVTGNGNKFNPDAKITRAEVMTIVNRMLDRTPDAEHMLPTMKKWIDNPEDAWYYEAVQEATNEHDYERDDLNVETWTELLTERDWKALETEWANNGGTSTPKADTENK